MDQPRIAVTGATGGMGGRVAQRLADRNVVQRLIVRDPARLNKKRLAELAGAEVASASYSDRRAMVSALSGIETVFFVSGFEGVDRLAQHKSAVDAFAEAGVKRVVYTSFLNAAPDAVFTLSHDHYHTEAYMEAVGLRFVALRNSFYQDLLPQFAVDGVIRGPAGDGRFAPVARDDIADVAVAALIDDDGPTVRLDVTGPALLTMSDVAQQLSETGSEPVVFVDETEEEAYASRSHFKVPRFEVDGWVTSYLAIARGELEIVSDTVERLTGHPPRSFRSFLESEKRAGRG